MSPSLLFCLREGDYPAQLYFYGKRDPYKAGQGVGKVVSD
jgi:hypothetical protein